MLEGTPWRNAHLRAARRHFLRLAGGGAAAALLAAELARGVEADAPQASDGGADDAELARRVAGLEYLTAPDKFGTVERGTPLPYTHPPEKLREIGLVRETWRLEVVSDPDAPAKLEAPLSKELGTALDWDGLLRLAEKRTVRFLKTMTCNNGGSPLGTGLWEGVPLRDVVWLTKPSGDLRRVFYYGYHNDDPQQRFQSSLPIGRVLEDPHGEPPVILCYKLNGEFLSGKRGGPVRMVVPENYGFKSVKWLQKVVLTNAPYANDTYANGNNDVDSWMKTFARFAYRPTTIAAGRKIPLTGFAQVGISGLDRVQVSFQSADAAPEADDPHFTRLAWKDATTLGPPTAWGGGLPQDADWRAVRGFDATTGRPKSWPPRYGLAHWALLADPLPAGKYRVRCRTIDAQGVAQPLPRPFPKSGRNGIEQVELTVEA